MGAPRIRGWEIFAQDLRLTIEKALQPPVIGMGHSLGAVTTLMAAASAPHLFAALVLIEPALFPRSVLWRIAVLKFLGLGGTLRPARRARRRKRVFKDRQAALERFADGRGIFKSWSPEFVEAYLACGLLQKDAQRAVLTCDPELEAQIFESVPLNVWSYVKKLAVPVLVIRGEASDVFAVKAAEGIRAVRPDARIAVIRRAGHFVPMERPAACARVILPFLRSLDSTAAAEGAGRSTRTRRVA
jgi:pimeloyl-ACP methyl ester carboxylesterase